MSSRCSRAAVAGAVMALLTLVAACGDDADAPASRAGAPTEAELDGRTFTSTEVDGHDLADGTTVVLSFADGAVVVEGGCNSMRGGYELSDGALTVEQLSQTRMACEPELMDQDTWLAGFLEAAPVATIDGDDLTLSADGVTIVLAGRPS